MTGGRRWMRWLGGALALAGVAFVAREVWLLRDDVAAMAGKPALLAGTGAGAIAYAAALMLLALGWAGLVRRDDVDVPRGALVRCFAASSIAKYLPGNVFHFAGRQVLAGRLGVAQRRAAAATVAETLATLAAALVMAALVIAVPQRVSLWLALLAALAGLALATRRQPLAAMLALACAFFLVNQLLVCMLALALEQPAATLLPLSAAYLVAWAAGNVVPGAPGGLGVREAAFVSLTGTFTLADEPLAVTLAIAMRLVSLLGDALFFAAGAAGTDQPVTTTESP